MQTNSLERKVKRLGIAVIVLAVLLALTAALTVCLLIRVENAPAPLAAVPTAEPSGEVVTFRFGPGNEPIPNGVRFGAGGTGCHPVGVFMGGAPLTGIEAVSADESVCVIDRIEGNTLFVQNIALGTSDVTVTKDGKAVAWFTWYIGP